MIELPEALNLAKQLKILTGAKVKQVLPPSKPHKFTWFGGDVCEYDKKLCGKRLTDTLAFGIFVELRFEDNFALCINDGVNPRLTEESALPKDYQLVLIFEDGRALTFTVAMYGGIVLHGGDFDNEYYIKSKNYISPFSTAFEGLFCENLAKSKDSLSAKAFLATEQRFVGIGNGVLQDILFVSKINPKQKIKLLSQEKLSLLLKSTVSVLSEMTQKGGRDTEKDIYGNVGGYETKMSKNTLLRPCPVCGGAITKEAYLGGSVYYCKLCQPILK